MTAIPEMESQKIYKCSSRPPSGSSFNMTLYGFLILNLGGEILPGVEKAKVTLLPRLGGSGHPGEQEAGVWCPSSSICTQ